MTWKPGQKSSRANAVVALRILAGAAAVAAVLFAASGRPQRADAAFHFAVIDEVMFGYGGDPNIQYVEMRMLVSGQNVTAHAILGYFNTDGSYGGDILELPGNVPGSSGRYLIASTGFAAAAGVTPEFTVAPVTLPATGMICIGGGGGVFPLNPPTWTRTNMLNWVDCVPYGGYVGPPIKNGPASPFGLGDGTSSLTRISDTDNTSVDFALACPAPEANTKAVGFNHDNHIDLPPTKPFDDLTWPNSDLVGDGCGDADDDNDNMSDVNELALPGPSCPSATAATDPLKADTDGDRVLDGAECALGADPASAASKPSPTACGVTTDMDGDRLSDRAEFCGYNSNPNSTDTDGDMAAAGARDGCEAASINNDRIVNSGDQLLMVQEIIAQPTPSLRLPSFDVNRDGVVNAGDQLLLALFIATAGQCP
ncbi:MAG: hypothetical protein HY874_10550 [Chloroflexi bacterium]|nr:hypothetical protein [Chloroflexota bacterium]